MAKRIKQNITIAVNPDTIGLLKRETKKEGVSRSILVEQAILDKYAPSNSVNSVNNISDKTLTEVRRAYRRTLNLFNFLNKHQNEFIIIRADDVNSVNNIENKGKNDTEEFTSNDVNSVNNIENSTLSIEEEIQAIPHKISYHIADDGTVY